MRPPASATVPVIGGDRLGAVDDIEADGGRLGRPTAGHRGAVRLSPGAATGRAGSEVVDGQLVGLQPAGRVVLLEGQAEAAERLAGGAASEVVSIRAPSVSSATPTIPVMFTPRSARAVATRASEPGRSSSWTVNQTVTRHLLCDRWYPLASGIGSGPTGYAIDPMPAPLGKVPTRRCPTSRSSAATIRRPRGPRSGSSASGAWWSTTSTCASARSRRASCGGSSSGWVPARSSTRHRGAYRDAGLALPGLDEAGIVARLLADPRLLRLPLVRRGNDVTVGRAEATWAAWLRSAAARLSAVDCRRRPRHDQSGPGERPT